MCSDNTRKKLIENQELSILLIDEDKMQCLGVKDGLYFIAHFCDDGKIFHKHLINQVQYLDKVKNNKDLLKA